MYIIKRDSAFVFFDPVQYEMVNANVQFSWYESIGCLDKLKDFVVHENDKWLKPVTPFC